MNEMEKEVAFKRNKKTRNRNKSWWKKKLFSNTRRKKKKNRWIPINVYVSIFMFKMNDVNKYNDKLFFNKLTRGIEKTFFVSRYKLIKGKVTEFRIEMTLKLFQSSFTVIERGKLSWTVFNFLHSFKSAINPLLLKIMITLKLSKPVKIQTRCWAFFWLFCCFSVSQ